MKKLTLQNVLRMISGFLAFFLTIGFAISCCMMLFLNNSRLENVSEVLLETEDKRNILSEKYAQILSQATGEELDERLSREQLSEMIRFTTEGLMRRHFYEGSFQPELYHQELKQYLGTMRLLGTKKPEVLS